MILKRYILKCKSGIGSVLKHSYAKVCVFFFKLNGILHVKDIKKQYTS